MNEAGVRTRRWAVHALWLASAVPVSVAADQYRLGAPKPDLGRLRAGKFRPSLVRVTVQTFRVDPRVGFGRVGLGQIFGGLAWELGPCR